MRQFILFVFLSTAFLSYSQKKGEFLESGSPVDNLWESVDGAETGAPIAGLNQQFFFLIPDGSDQSMMAPFEMEEMGFACPSYFTVSLDAEFLYLDVHNPCAVDLSEEDRFITVGYRLNEDHSRLTLIVDGEEYEYQHWSYE